ncbi:MAG: aldo/keto reductase [Gammaproteobacteria bacterium]|nr:aldo/keto reductase [Gammaproteobacteria bacterium]MCP4089438.1 aldo/keto reductase [Gammaproteobacteria bacterium]MCP4277554.1 aldo/keto reductase [Gammaproteobacteria bacterium]MCP4831162.1 aldo/keto reductase [Gammaproteobacteria bacterium]MCP4929209.1 aldo/keto reductase [Gammaproteobacteria bacterium]
MKTKQLGNSDLEVSVVGLGCMMFGSMCDEATSTSVIMTALEEGVNFFDTADIYGAPPGTSEKYVGNALGTKRKDIILTTKFGAQAGGQGGSAEGGGTRDYIMSHVEESLSNLGTDYLDLYQYHFPDVDTPAEETLRALEDLIQQGKVRYIGCSNMSSTQLQEALSAAENAGTSKYVSAQNWYSLLTRNMVDNLLPITEKENISIIPYFPLESGLLTGKYRKGQEDPEGSRLAAWGGAFKTDEKMDKVEALINYAESIGHSMLDIAIAGLTNRPYVATVIAGVTKPEQLCQNVAAGNVELTTEQLSEIDRICAT